MAVAAATSPIQAWYFYEVYECADGRYVSVAAIEAKFHAELLRLLEIDAATMPPQMDRSRWPR